jgi:hypothetical protein
MRAGLPNRAERAGRLTPLLRPKNDGSRETRNPNEGLLPPIITQKLPGYFHKGADIMKAKLLVVAALLMLLGAAPAQADIIYNILLPVNSNPGGFDTFAGFITTNGDLGVLEPDDILSWELVETSHFNTPVHTQVRTFASALGGTLTFTPMSLIATPTNIVFDPLPILWPVGGPFLGFSHPRRSYSATVSEVRELELGRAAYPPFSRSHLSVKFLEQPAVVIFGTTLTSEQSPPPPSPAPSPEPAYRA